MSIARTREYLLSLHRTAETLQWGDNLVYWVLDKAVGGKMFAVMNSEPGQAHVLSFPVPADRFHELLEIDGIQPAPYFARIHWVALQDWNVLPTHELHEHLRAAYERVEGKLPRREQRVLELNDREYRALLRERRAALKAKGS